MDWIALSATCLLALLVGRILGLHNRKLSWGTVGLTVAVGAGSGAAAAAVMYILRAL